MAHAKKSQPKLTFVEILALYLVVQNHRKGIETSFVDLSGYSSTRDIEKDSIINQYIAAHHIPYGKVEYPFIRYRFLWFRLEYMRETLGLLQAKAPHTRGGIAPTPDAIELFEHIGNDWHQWPIYIPIDGDKLQLEKVPLIEEDFPL